VSLRREIEWARYQERRRLLDEQAERQRLREPEPEPEVRIEHYCIDLGSTAVLLVPVLVLVILGLTCGWAVFWIGLGVLCFVLGVATVDRAPG
jgi:hypothetical protein